MPSLPPQKCPGPAYVNKLFTKAVLTFYQKFVIIEVPKERKEKK